MTAIESKWSVSGDEKTERSEPNNHGEREWSGERRSQKTIEREYRARKGRDCGAGTGWRAGVLEMP